MAYLGALVCPKPRRPLHPKALRMNLRARLKGFLQTKQEKVSAFSPCLAAFSPQVPINNLAQHGNQLAGCLAISYLDVFLFGRGPVSPTRRPFHTQTTSSEEGDAYCP